MGRRRRNGFDVGDILRDLRVDVGRDGIDVGFGGGHRNWNSRGWRHGRSHYYDAPSYPDYNGDGHYSVREWRESRGLPTYGYDDGYYGGYGSRHNRYRNNSVHFGFDWDNDHRRDDDRYRRRRREHDPEDLNRDGRVTRSERELFNYADEDGNGRLDSGERRELRRIDRDGDGRIDRHRRTRYNDHSRYDDGVDIELSFAPADDTPSRGGEHSWDLATAAIPEGAREPARRAARVQQAAYVPEDGASEPIAVPVLTQDAIARMKADGLTVREMQTILTSTDEQGRDLVSDKRLGELLKDVAKDGTLDSLKGAALTGGANAHEQAAQLLKAVAEQRGTREPGRNI